ncbi:hypothetical protein CRI94_13330 [Longibacter salinarum]|uniref:Thioredoxin domain-containing protein n=1 Tax=Longibacter salinarum TaxID=1850348 RepID=A0A2A8CVT8_9BACT|nr:thioredoxin family protein [Longibacter salinarum]PEN12508.1 hypothetical protein CRI94_13330 [Longibacter salinarum]
MLRTRHLPILHRWTLILALSVLGYASAVPEASAAQPIEWRSFETALAVADATDRWILVDIYAPWCGWCYKMKRETYPSVFEDRERPFVLTRLNRDDRDTMHRYRGRRLSSRQLAKELGAHGVPAVAILDASGTLVFNVSGFIRPELLHNILTYIRTEAYRTASFEAFQASQSRRPEPHRTVSPDDD